MPAASEILCYETEAIPVYQLTSDPHVPFRDVGAQRLSLALVGLKHAAATEDLDLELSGLAAGAIQLPHE